MKLGGTLRYKNNDYFVVMNELKSSTSWYLISPYHRDDVVARLMGEEIKHRVLSPFDLVRSTVPVDYVVEAVKITRVTGKTGIFRSRVILNEVLEALGSALSYNFASSKIIEDINEMKQGTTVRIFNARDEKVSLDYVRTQGQFEKISLLYEDIALSIDASLQVKIPKDVGFVVVDDRSKTAERTNQVAIKSLDYQTLRNMIDLDWYEKDGVLQKDYKAITSIKEFEEEVMLPMMEEYDACQERGEEFILRTDTETTGLVFHNLRPENPERDELVAIPLSWKDHQGVVIFIDMLYFNNVPKDYVLERLRGFLEGREGTVKIKKIANFKEKANTLASMDMFSEDFGKVPEEDRGEVVGEFEFKRENVNVVLHNGMFDGKVFYDNGVKLYINNDTLQMSFNLNPKVAKGNNKLSSLIYRLYGIQVLELSDILGKGNEGMYRAITDMRVAIIYGCADVDFVGLVFKDLKKLMGPKMFAQYQKQDIPIMNELYISEYYGLRADEQAVIEQANGVEEDLERLKKFIYNYVGIAVDTRNKKSILYKKLESGLLTEAEYRQELKNIKPDPQAMYEFKISSNQVKEVLFNILKYPPQGTTQSGELSADKFVMDKLQRFKLDKPSKVLEKDLLSVDGETVLIEADKINGLKYPLAYVLSVYGALNKEWVSYYKPIKEQHMEAKIFKGYSLARIETRRIMNPAQTMKGKLKKLIKAYTDEYYLMDFDQSQVEARIFASLAGFTEMITRLNDPEKDYHTETASAVHKIVAHKVPKSLRNQTKNISFGLPYGLGERKMAGNLYKEVNDETLYKTRKDIAKYKLANKPVIDKLEEFRREALVPVELSREFRWFIRDVNDPDWETRPYGRISNLLGFYRLFDLTDVKGDRGKEGAIMRPAGNFPIQSFAAELFRMIVMRFIRRLEEEGIRDKIIIHMTIHDELLFSVHKSIHPFLMYKILYESCVVTIKGHAKYFIGINIGDTWGECKDDKLEAPVLFVQRIIKRWDAGEFRDDDYSDAKNYVLKHKQEYIVQRIGEVVESIQPDVKEKPLDIVHLLDNFSNYTVRSYVSDYFKMNSEADKKDDDAVYISKLESWIIDYFGEGKEVLYPDGIVRKVYRMELETIEFEDEIVLEDEEDTEYWSFDTDELGERQLYVYDTYTSDITDEDTEFLESLDLTVENPRSVADLIVTKSPVYTNIKLLNDNLIINIPRKKFTMDVKKFLLPHESPDGYHVTFKEPLGNVRWVKVSKNLDLNALDEFVGGLK